MGRRRTTNSQFIAGAVIIVLAALIFFAPSYGWTIRAWLSPTPMGSGSSGASETDSPALSAQNDALKARLATLQVVESELPTSTPNTIRAMVYSRYPMNFRNELLVNAGSNDGVAVGAAVIFQGMLLGQVHSVFPHEALVQTVFDNDLKMPVRIGRTGADGLLQGSSYPIVGSIAGTAALAPGDIVYSAAPGIPYGIAIAQIAATSTSADSLFQQATLSFSYDVNNIETVLIAK